MVLMGCDSNSSKSTGSGENVAPDKSKMKGEKMRPPVDEK
jgi:hypothetical protein